MMDCGYDAWQVVLMTMVMMDGFMVVLDCDDRMLVHGVMCVFRVGHLPFVHFFAVRILLL